MRVLLAGVGNVFLGDDGFGCEVAKAIGGAALPAGVDVADYGIKGVHLAYELLDGGYDTLIMIDAAPVGGPPGTLAVVEVDPADPGGCGPLAAPAVDAHSMHPLAVLQVLHALGGRIGRVLVVGCQPGELAEQMGLSPPVRAAVPGAVSLAAAVAAAEAAPGGLPAAAPAQGTGQWSERRPARA
jgi:hydrogenase maturation protease